MIELTILIISIVALIRFASTIRAWSSASKVKAEVFAEQVIAGSVVERSKNMEEFVKQTEGKKLYSHDEVMHHFRIDN